MFAVELQLSIFSVTAITSSTETFGKLVILQRKRKGESLSEPAKVLYVSVMEQYSELGVDNIKCGSDLSGFGQMMNRSITELIKSLTLPETLEKSKFPFI